jgi:phosphate starvation-inducible protein PhoH
MKKIRFFNTGLNLITFDNHNLIINKEILENYQQINLQENKSLLKIIKNENEIKDLEKIENNLNLIIKFYKNEKIREEFFKSLFEKKDPIKTLEEKIISQNHNYILLSNNSQR